MADIKIEYGYETVPTIAAFAKSDAFFRGLLGPYGSGKSSGCIVEIVRRALAQKPGADGIRRSKWVVVRNSYPMLRDTTIASVFQWLPPQHMGKYLSSEHRYVIKAFRGAEFEILFRALDKPDDVRNLLSLEVTGAWVNEAREIPWPIFEALQGRVGRYPRVQDGGATWYGLWADTNPPDTDSDWYRFFEDRNWLNSFNKMREKGDLPMTMRAEDYAAIFKQPGGLSDEAENLPNLPGGRRYYATMAAGKSPEWVKVYVNGEYGFVVEGRAVYTDYIDSVHCKAVEPVAGSTIIRSWDFGLTPACAFSQVLPDGRWLTFDEMTATSMGIDRFSDDVLEHCSRAFRGSVQFEDWGDPAGQQRAQTDERTCFEIMHGKNILISGSEQGETLRLEAVRWPMRQLHPEGARFILHPRCRTLRKGFMGGYHYARLRTSGPERYHDKPFKNVYSHIHDALQYGMVQYFGGGLTKAPDPYDDYPEPAYGSNLGRTLSTGY